MAGSGYQVASASQLLGAKPPTRREADEVYRQRMEAIDQTNRDRSALHRTNNVKTVRFANENRDDDDVEEEFSATSPAASREAAHASHRSRLEEQPRGDAVCEGGEDVTHESIITLPTLPDSTYQVPGTASGKQPVLRDARKSPVVVEFPLRVKELRAGETLPAKHRHRILQTRLDTNVASTSTASPSTPTPTSSLTRSGSKRSRKDAQVTEIYFSPIDVTQSQICLSDPIEDPEAELTPTQERYDEAQRAAWQSDEPPTPRPQQPRAQPEPEIETEPEKLMLKPEQVDRLVEALAKCPLLHIHVSRQWWDDAPDDATVLSDTAPSLTDDSSGSFYSQPNQGFLTEQRSPSVTREILEEEFAREYPDHPKARKSSSPAVFDFGGIAMVDPKVHGSPIRFISQDYRLGANVLQVGACSFLNIPYGTSLQSNLRIEPQSSKSINCRVMLQVINQTLERRTGKKAYLLVAELDVTESFTKAALLELSIHSGMALDDIELLAPGLRPQDRDVIDWCALADEVQTALTVTDMVEAAATSFAKLTAETCTMQTLTLMSELERLKTQHQDFLVARPTGFHENGMISGVNIPWTSQHLDQLLYEEDPANIRGEASKASRLLRDRVVGALTQGCVREQAFWTKIWWGDRMRSVHCVPLMEGMDGKVGAWVAFLSGESKFVPF